MPRNQGFRVRNFPLVTTLALLASLAASTARATILITGATEVTSSTTWNDNVVVQPGAVLRVKGTASPGATLTITGNVDNYGLVTVEASAWLSSIQLSSSPVQTLHNYSAAEFRLSCGVANANLGGGAVVNDGLITVQSAGGGGSGTMFGVPHVTNASTGTIRVLGAARMSISLNQSIFNSGSIIIDPNATLSFIGFGFLTSTGSIGGGALEFINGSVTPFTQNPAITRLLLHSASARLPQPIDTAQLDLDLATADLTVPELRWNAQRLGTLGGSTVRGNLSVGPGITLAMGGASVWGNVVTTGTLTAASSSSILGYLTVAAGGGMAILPGSAAMTWSVRDGISCAGAMEMRGAVSSINVALSLSGGILDILPTGSFKSYGGGQSLNRVNGRVQNAGSMVIEKYCTLAIPSGDFTNTGLIQATGAPLSLELAEDAAARNHGTIELQNNVAAIFLTQGQLINEADGVVQGSGYLYPGVQPLLNRGVMRPGLSPGVLHVSGDLACASSSSLQMEFGGTTAGSGFDWLDVSGQAQLAGALHVSPFGGYVPAAGALFPVITWAGHTGTFDRLDLTPFSPTLLVLPSPGYPGFGAGGVTLRAVEQGWESWLALPGPSARAGHAAGYAAASDRMIVFGGRDDAGLRNDVWVLTNAAGGAPAWVQLAPGGVEPAPREDATCVYDSANDRLILVGGRGDAAGQPVLFDDVWILVNASGAGAPPVWLSPAATGTPARAGALAAYDVVGNRLLLFGGDTSADGSTPPDAGLNVLSGANGLGVPMAWNEVVAAGGAPAGRSGAGGAFSAAGDAWYIVGGQGENGSPLPDLHCLHGWLGGIPTWETVEPENAPLPAVTGAPACLDVSHDRLLRFGGESTDGEHAELLFVESVGAASAPDWSLLPAGSGAPPARRGHSAVYDSGRHRMIIFGGEAGATRFADVWRLTVSGAAGEVAAVEAPPATSPPTGLAFSGRAWSNPVRGAFAFSVYLPAEGALNVAVFDVAGHRLATLASGPAGAGERSVRWTGLDDGGRRLPAGTFFVRASSGLAAVARRIVWIP